MNDKRTTPDTPSAAKGRRKRAAPTIDLTATDVTATQVPATEVPPTSEADPPPPEPAPVAESPVLEESMQQPPQAEAKPAPEDAPRKQPFTLGYGITGPVLAAGVAGAAVMAALLLTLWLTGLLPVRFAALTMTRARVSALEMQLQDLQKRPAAPVAAADTQAVDALTQRVAAMEASIKNMPAPSAPDSGLADRVAAADNAMKSLGVALAALNKRNDDLAANTAQARERADAAEKAVTNLRASVQDVSKTASAGASSADLEPLQQRIATLEQSAKTANAEIAKATASDTAARLALSAATLRDAVLRGAPFVDELAQAKSLGAGDSALAPLTPFAATGVPSEKVLATELSAILPGMIKTAGAPPASGGFIERLQTNASQLVRIRPVDAPAGNDAATVLARLEVNAARADIAAALSDIGKLPEPARQQAADWVTRAGARQNALAAARQFAAGTARSLGSK